MSKRKKWMSSGVLKAAPSGKVNHEQGIIEGVSVCTVGEAKGHGVSLDSEFVSDVVRFGSERKQGLKARFGHPNMCGTALGTFLGRFKNFREEGDQAKADLFLSNEAKESPSGNLYDYVLGMAANEPDMFGTSIVFTPGAAYKRSDDGEKVIVDEWTGNPVVEHEGELSEEIFVECGALHACDAVDDPAANEGLFSAFSSEMLAAQMTEFLDLHPDIWGALKDNPAIVEALAGYGDKMDEFVQKYEAYRGARNMADDEKTTQDEALEASSVEETTEDAPIEEGVEEAAEEAATEEGLEASEDAPEVEPEPEPEPVEDEPVEDEPSEELSKSIDVAEFNRIADEFGAEIAVETVKNGGNYESALKSAFEKTKAENEQLKATIEERKTSSASAFKPEEKTEKKSLFNTGK